MHSLENLTRKDHPAGRAKHSRKRFVSGRSSTLPPRLIPDRKSTPISFNKRMPRGVCKKMETVVDAVA